jgi:hypothetical protein
MVDRDMRILSATVPGVASRGEVIVKPDRARVLSEGLIAGFLGYVAIVLFYGVLNLVMGDSFFSTAALLGSGLVSPTRSSGVAGAVLAFNGLHVIAFLVIGLMAAWIVMQTERHPSLFVIALFIALAGLFLSVALFLSTAAVRGEGVPIGTVIAANVLAGFAMGGYLLKAHPRLWTELRDHLDPESEHPAPH